MELIGIDTDNDKIDFFKGISALNKKGWLHRQGNEFQMHHVISKMCFYQFRPKYFHFHKLSNNVIERLEADNAKKVMLSQWLNFGYSIEQITRSDRVESKGGLFISIASNLDLSFVMPLAAKYYFEAVEMYKINLSEHKMVIQQTNDRLANIYVSLGKIDEAKNTLDYNINNQLEEEEPDFDYIFEKKMEILDFFILAGVEEEFFKEVEEAKEFLERIFHDSQHEYIHFRLDFVIFTFYMNRLDRENLIKYRKNIDHYISKYGLNDPDATRIIKVADIYINKDEGVSVEDKSFLEESVKKFNKVKSLEEDIYETIPFLQQIEEQRPDFFEGLDKDDLRSKVYVFKKFLYEDSKKLRGELDPTCFFLLMEVSYFLIKIERFSDAKTNLESCYKIAIQIYGQKHLMTKAILNDIDNLNKHIAKQ